MRFMQCRSRRRQRAFRSHQFSNSPFVLTSPDPGRNSAIQYFVKYCVIKSCKSGKYGFSVSDLSPESKHASFWENLWKIVQRKKRVFYRKMRYNKLEIRLQPSLDAPHSFCVSDLSIHETHEWRTILANQGAWCTFWIAPCLKKKLVISCWEKLQYSCLKEEEKILSTPEGWDLKSRLSPLQWGCLLLSIADWEEGSCQRRQACTLYK